MITTVFAIDPGSERSGWVRYSPAEGQVLGHGDQPNEELLRDLRLAPMGDVVVIEWTAPRGMPASAQLFETLWWAGRFAQAADPLPVERVPRLDVKRHLTGRTAATDTNVRAALIDRFGGIGGKAVAIGRKAAPGPLYGIAGDAWAALAVAVTWADQQ